MFKRLIITVFAAVAMCGRNAECQVSMGLDFDFNSYLENEKITSRVVVSNMGSEALIIGGLRQSASLEFRINRGVDVASRKSEGLIVRNRMILPGEAAIIYVNLDEHYSMLTPGMCQVRAELDIGGKSYVSRPASLDVVPGIVLASAERFASDDPEKRILYSLRRWNRNGEDHLFLAAMNLNDRISLGIFDLGAYIRSEKPALSVQADGTTAVEYAMDSGVWVKTIFRSSSKGVIFSRRETGQIVETQAQSAVGGIPAPGGATNVTPAGAASGKRHGKKTK